MSLKFRLSALNFFQNIVFATTVISLGTYLLNSLEFSGRQVGMIYATNALAATFAPPLVGWLADRRFSADRLLVVLNFMAAIALTGCFLVTSFSAFYVLMLVFNFSFIPTFALLASVCFQQLPTPADDYPVVRVWGTVAFILVGLGLSYFGMENSPVPLLVGVGAAVIMGVAALSLRRIPPQPGFTLADLGGPEVRRVLREPGMIVLVVAMLLSSIPSAFYYSFVNPFLNEMGWANAAAKMSLGQVGEVFIILALPLALRYLRFRTVIFWGLFCWGARYFAFGLGRPGEVAEWLLFAGILVQGFCFAWVVIAGQIYIDKRMPQTLRSTAQGLISFANQGLGIFVGSWIAGEVVTANAGAGGGHDWWLIWLVPGVVGVLGAIYFWVFFPKRGAL
ncbi:MAG: MFS transporter [Bacteroidota bacterium]